jgi:DNA-binding FadR family transcriptional regulator
MREALIALELYGLVVVRQGSGIYVQPWYNQPLRVNIFDRGVSPFEILGARCIIESEIAAEAAKIITDRELIGLQHAIQKMKDNFTNLDEHEKYDREFHILISKAARNTALTAVIDSLWALHTRGILWNQLYRFTPPEKLHGDRLDEHLAIYDALKRRDPSDAREAMRTHLDRAIRTLMAAADSLKNQAAEDDPPAAQSG